jgi:hypothetical protein
MWDRREDPPGVSVCACLRILAFVGLLFLVFVLGLPSSRAAGEEADFLALPHDIIVEGRMLSGAQARAAADGTVLLPVAAVAEALGNIFRFDRYARMIYMRRAADNQLFSLDLQSGEVRAGNRLLGLLPDVERQRADSLFLTVNAVSVLTGAHIRRDDDAERIEVALDPRLRPVSEYDLYVNGARLTVPTPSPSSVKMPPLVAPAMLGKPGEVVSPTGVSEPVTTGVTSPAMISVPAEPLAPFISTKSDATGALPAPPKPSAPQTMTTPMISKAGRSRIEALVVVAVSPATETAVIRPMASFSFLIGLLPSPYLALPRIRPSVADECEPPRVRSTPKGCPRRFNRKG